MIAKGKVEFLSYAYGEVSFSGNLPSVSPVASFNLIITKGYLGSPSSVILKGYLASSGSGPGPDPGPSNRNVVFQGYLSPLKNALTQGFSLD